MKGKKKRMGRPTLKPKYRRTAIITLRLTGADRGLLAKEAEAKGMSISSYLLYCWKKGDLDWIKSFNSLNYAKKDK